MNMGVASSQPVQGGRSQIDLQLELSHRKRLQDKLSFLADLNHLIIESTGDCILLVDQDGRLQSINRTGCALLGIEDLAEWLDKPWTLLFPDADIRSGRLIQGPFVETSRFEASSRTLSGEFKWWSIRFAPIMQEDARAEQVLIIARDITDHMLIERALRQSEEAFRKLFEDNPIGIIITTLEHKISRVNGAFLGMLGFTEGELLRKNFRHHFALADSLPEENFERLLSAEIRSFQADVPFLTKRREIVWGQITVSLLRDGENHPAAFSLMVENITERRQNEEKLLSYQQQLQSLTSELSLSEERERRRIASNLHDRIGQTLAFARLKLGSLAERMEPKAAEELRELIEQAIGDTRSLTVELSPPVLYELGLVAALEWLARKIQQEHGVATRFHDDGQPKPLDDNFRVVLFQAVRELLVNVVKHASASNAQVLVRRDADALRIIIEDDGAGFNTAMVTANLDGRSFGLFHIRERLEYLGGRMNLRSEIGRGTRVTLIAPLNFCRHPTNIRPTDYASNERPDSLSG